MVPSDRKATGVIVVFVSEYEQLLCVAGLEGRVVRYEYAMDTLWLLGLLVVIQGGEEETFLFRYNEMQYIKGIL